MTSRPRPAMLARGHSPNAREGPEQFFGQRSDSVVARETDFDRFSPERIRANAARFSAAEFKRRLIAEVERLRGH